MARVGCTSPTHRSTGSTWKPKHRRAWVPTRCSTPATAPSTPAGAGSRSSLYLMFFDGFLGGSSNWQQVSYDARSYRRLTRDGRHKLAFWTFGDLVTGGSARDLDLPSTGADTYNRSGRGYPQGRFRGEQMVYGEVEYRWMFMKSGLLGMVAFLNTQTLSDETDNQKLFDHSGPGGGAGLRVALNKRSKTNLCLDSSVLAGARRPSTSPCRKRSEGWKSGSSRVPPVPGSASRRSARDNGRCCRSMRATVRCSRPAARSGFLVYPPLSRTKPRTSPTRAKAATPSSTSADRRRQLGQSSR